MFRSLRNCFEIETFSPLPNLFVTETHVVGAVCNTCPTAGYSTVLRYIGVPFLCEFRAVHIRSKTPERNIGHGKEILMIIRRTGWHHEVGPILIFDSPSLTLCSKRYRTGYRKGSKVALWENRCGNSINLYLFLFYNFF